jgi:hypothetical protein
MLGRRTFVAGAAALVACSPRAALAFVETTASGDARPSDEQARATLATVAVIAATRLLVRTVWRPPPVFPEFAPIAYYVGRGDIHYPNEPVIWLNPDHPELVSPRASRLTDEVPLLMELALASVDVHLTGVQSLGLERLDPSQRRAAAAVLASNAAVVAKYSPYSVVDDAEFDRRAFAFAVLRQLTPGIGGVAPLITKPAAMPPEEPLAAYAGRDADPSVPRGWGVIRMTSTSIVQSPHGYEAYARAFVLATADREPPESAVKRAYDAARADDERASGDHFAARRRFAAPYVKQVAALFGR